MAAFEIAKVHDVLNCLNPEYVDVVFFDYEEFEKAAKQKTVIILDQVIKMKFSCLIRS